MTRISRRAFNITALAAAATPVRRAWSQTAEFNLKFGHEALDTHPVTIRLNEAAQTIAKRTNGRVNIQMFPNNQLGGATDMLSQTRSGALEFTLLGTVIISTLAPVAAISGVGYAFPDYDHVWSAMDGELGAYVRQAVEKSGVRPMKNIWDLGFRHVANNIHPVKTPSDLSGIKLRVAVGALYVSLFKGLGASPVSMNFSELYSSLQTKVIDGIETPLQIFVTFKMYEVIKYASLTNHMWDGQWLIANGRAWSKLPPDIQAIIEEEFNAACFKQRDDLKAIESRARADLTAKGMIINDVDTAPFREALVKAGFYKEWKEKFDPNAWALLEKSVGAIN
jgi:tripartite ATP-independent transporter DctP family solute receptor